MRAQAGHAFVPFVRRHIKRAAALLQDRAAAGLPLRDLTIVLTRDREMSKLHEQFMRIKGPTDVLTFPIDSDARGRVSSGEVYVCVPEARRQAKSRRIPPQHEVLLYALHGMLHLLGYDDTTTRGYRLMHRTEDEILNKLGVGAVFAHSRLAKGKPGAARRSRR